MLRDRRSLLAGRNRSPLDEHEIRRAHNMFLGFEPTINVRYESNAHTCFHIAHEENGEEYGEIVFGPDIYPGRGVVDPNSALGLKAAVAHELTHYHRWKDKTALPEEAPEHLDEALTSLQAIMRYDRELDAPDVRQLIADALQRLQLYAQALEMESGE